MTHEYIVKYLIENRLIKNQNNYDNALYYACKNGNKTIVKYLIRKGATINQYDDTPLTAACHSGNENIVEYLIELGADINKGYINLPLHSACRNGNVKIVKYLVNHGADVNKKDANILTPFFYSYKYLNIANYLLKHGAIIDQDILNKTLAHACTEKNNEKMIKFLIKKGANINDKKFNALIYAVFHRNYDIVKYLIEQKADVNIRDKNNDIPLHIACKIGEETIVKYLIEHGANIYIRNKYGETSFSISKKNSHSNILKYLCEKRRPRIGIDLGSIGIDLGSTYTCISIFNNDINGIKLIDYSYRRKISPCIGSFDPKIFGNNKYSIYNIKRILGTSLYEYEYDKGIINFIKYDKGIINFIKFLDEYHFKI